MSLAKTQVQKVQVGNSLLTGSSKKKNAPIHFILLSKECKYSLSLSFTQYSLSAYYMSGLFYEYESLAT